MIFESQRQFQLWDYTVSHRQLLLRSPRTPEITTNLDIVFWEVRYVDVGTLLEGIAMRAASSEQLARVPPLDGHDHDPIKGYTIVSGRGEFVVVCSGVRILENTLDIFDSTIVYANRDRAIEEHGTVLYNSHSS